MDKIIIGIHGLSNKPARDIQSKWWVESIAEGLRTNCRIATPRFQFEAVYWADLLYKYPMHHDPAMRFDSNYDSQPYAEAPSGALKKYDDGFLDKARATAQNLGGKILDWTKGQLRIERSADFLLGRVLKDLAFYYDKSRQVKNRKGAEQPVKDVLQAELENALLKYKTNYDVMLIGHSMGSIIAYDVLRNLGHPDQGLSVSHFVTIGSPLGLPHVKLNIDQERAYDPTIRTPTVVSRSWMNFADRTDPVAFDTHLADDYQPNKAGVQVRDDLILNDYKSPDGLPNPHKLYGYLRAPEVSEHIRSFLGI